MSLQENLRKYKKIRVKRFDADQRWYALEGTEQWKPSVTSIINGACAKGKHFDDWLMKNGKEAIVIRDKAALNGTLVHESIEALLNGETVNIKDDFISKGLMSFERFYIECSPTIEEKEIFLYHRNIPWAGTPDIIGRISNKLSIIDIKTGDYRKSHELQQLMYMDLWNTIFPEHPIEEIYGLYLKCKWIKEPNYILRRFNRKSKLHTGVYDLWNFLNNKPWPKTKANLKKTFTLNIKEKNDVSSLL